MALQGLGLLLLTLPLGFGGALLAAFLLGLGTSMAYPTLIAWVADRAPLEARATALGLYRFFRDGGYVLGALLASAGPEGLVGGVGAGLVLLAWATGKRLGEGRPQSQARP